MKRSLTVYFDYTCPYCYRGIMNLIELLPDFPELSVSWIPCEAHPYPETPFMHSDLASQAMLITAELGGDLIAFHQKIFHAHFIEHQRIDAPSILADIDAGCGADRDKVMAALEKGQYRQAVLDNNTLVWGTLKFEAVPCYQSKSRLLASREDVMISRNQLKDFLDQAAKG